MNYILIQKIIDNTIQINIIIKVIKLPIFEIKPLFINNNRKHFITSILNIFL